MHCKRCGFPAPDTTDGWHRLRNHLSDTHGIEGWVAASEAIAEDESPRCVLF